jgi:hypothetical protein
MALKYLSSPKEAAYPLIIKKTFVAPGDRVSRGELIYELEDAAQRRAQIRMPLSGEQLEGILPTGTRLPEPSIILSFEAITEEAPARVEPVASPSGPTQGPATQPPPAPPSPRKSAAPPRRQSRWYGPITLLAISLCGFLVWAALHVTHSLAPNSLRFGLPALAMALPWLLYLLLPGKDNAGGGAEAYLGGLLLGTSLSLAATVASLFIPPQILARLDNARVHQLFKPITHAPMLKMEDHIFLLGRRIAESRFMVVPLSNGGLLEFSGSMSAERKHPAWIWSPDGRRGDERWVNRIMVFAQEDGSTRIAVYEEDELVGGYWPLEALWNLELLDNEGRALASYRRLPETKGSFGPPPPPGPGTHVNPYVNLSPGEGGVPALHLR